MIECINVSLGYKDGNESNLVLSDINIKINAGENVVLLGPSGSGKSSLVYMLSGIRRPSSGSIIYNGKDLFGMDNDKLSAMRRHKFGYIFQFHFLIPYLNVIENVMVGAPEYNEHYKKIAAKKLQQLGIERHINKKVYELSGGQRQRVAIARALVSEPDVIFADEPTASVDHKNAKEIINILKSYKENRTLVIATHDTSILEGDELMFKVENKSVKRI